ncbi:MAG TPA: hypothetical protein VLI65_11105 [Pyrinomonadaceae bacterium]|nr:hypothetical protein [Pyrinomonadaceae bacterium]
MREANAGFSAFFQMEEMPEMTALMFPSETESRPPDNTGSIQAFGTDHAVPFRPKIFDKKRRRQRRFFTL